MAKKEIKYCKKCQRYTRHICVGKEKVKLSGEEIAFSILNLGMYPLVKKVLDLAEGNGPAKYWECQKCRDIVKI